MRIGFLGAGRLASTLARLFLRAGHTVTLVNSREPDSLAELVAGLGPGAQAGRPSDLVELSDVIVLAVPWQRVLDAVTSLGETRGAIVIDATNNRVGPRPEDLVDLQGRGSSEVVAASMPDARVVKAFNHQRIPALLTLDSPGEERAMFVGGDSPAAKAVVAELICDIGGIPLDTGSLAEADRLQGTGGGPLAGHGRLLTVREARDAAGDSVRDIVTRCTAAESGRFQRHHR
jgi:predicted dinucleotide-binding enzyme